MTERKKSKIVAPDGAALLDTEEGGAGPEPAVVFAVQVLLHEDGAVSLANSSKVGSQEYTLIDKGQIVAGTQAITMLRAATDQLDKQMTVSMLLAALAPRDHRLVMSVVNRLMDQMRTAQVASKISGARV